MPRRRPIRSAEDGMSRSGYCDGADDNWQHIMWRGVVASATRGRRGQSFFKEMLAALDAMPAKRLVANELETPDIIPCSHWGMFEARSVCAIGAVGQARGIDMKKIDPEDYGRVSSVFNIAEPLVQEIVYVNDEWGDYRETPEARFIRMRKWVVSQIIKARPRDCVSPSDEIIRWADDGGSPNSREVAGH
jgi:hypothetical protein